MGMALGLDSVYEQCNCNDNRQCSVSLGRDTCLGWLYSSGMLGPQQIKRYNRGEA